MRHALCGLLVLFVPVMATSVRAGADPLTVRPLTNEEIGQSRPLHISDKGFIWGDLDDKRRANYEVCPRGLPGYYLGCSKRLADNSAQHTIRTFCSPDGTNVNPGFTNCWSPPLGVENLCTDCDWPCPQFVIGANLWNLHGRLRMLYKLRTWNLQSDLVAVDAANDWWNQIKCTSDPPGDQVNGAFHLWAEGGGGIQGRLPGWDYQDLNDDSSWRHWFDLQLFRPRSDGEGARVRVGILEDAAADPLPGSQSPEYYQRAWQLSEHRELDGFWPEQLSDAAIIASGYPLFLDAEERRDQEDVFLATCQDLGDCMTPVERSSWGGIKAYYH